MDLALQQLKDAAKTASVAERRKMVAQLNALQMELEEEDQTMDRISFLKLQTAIVQIALDLKIFDHLAESKTSLTVAQIATKANADENLTRRILRYLACTGYIKEENQDIFSANSVTFTLVDTGRQAAFHFFCGWSTPIHQNLPNYLKETKYANVTDMTHTPFHYGYETNVTPWEWFKAHPQDARIFFSYLAARETNLPAWIPGYPMSSRGAGVAETAPLFIDVGGGMGQQSRLVRTVCPQLTGRVIVQDLAEVLDASPSFPNIEKIPHDFYQSQPETTRNARFYYMKQVLHDYPDEKAAVILRKLKEAMGPESIILIDEIVIPNTGADLLSVNLDMVVMAALAGMERSRAQWDTLLASVGLRCREVYSYDPLRSDAVLEVVVDESVS